MDVSVSRVEVGDQLEVWPMGYDAPSRAKVLETSEGERIRSLVVQLDGAEVEIHVPHSHTVKLLC